MATNRPGRDPQPADSDRAAAIADVLRGSGSYDALDDPSQAAVRSVWRRQIDDRLDSLDLRAEFEAVGVAYSELDAHGAVVARSAVPGQGS